VSFDESITSPSIKAGAMDEAASIWKIYGVDLQYAEPSPDTALSLDVLVERTPPSRKYTGAPAVLGHTTVASGPAVQAPLRISFDAVTALLDSQRSANPLSSDLACVSRGVRPRTRASTSRPIASSNVEFARGDGSTGHRQHRGTRWPTSLALPPCNLAIS
jgi:hypothetical protein